LLKETAKKLTRETDLPRLKREVGESLVCLKTQNKKMTNVCPGDRGEGKKK